MGEATDLRHGRAGEPLGAKIGSPRSPPLLVRRSRLDEVIAGVPDTGVVVVTGAAGSGKSTCVAEALRAGGDRVAWLAVDAGDDEPGRFWSLVVAAMATAHGRAEPTSLTVEGSAPTEGIASSPGYGIRAARAALGELAAEAPSWLVVDRFEVLRDPRVARELGQLCTDAPAGLRVAVASRCDPAMPLTRLRLEGRLREVRDEHLRFRADEIDRYAELHHVELGPDGTTTMMLRTEGWVVAVQLALLAAEGEDDPPAFLGAFVGTERTLADYLRQEVLDRQDEDVRRFLLETSVTDRLTPGLCDAVTDRVDSAAVLDRLDRCHLLVTTLEPGRQWFRYHPLFLDLLRAELARAEPGVASELHHRAALWFDHHGEPGAAIEHHLAAGAFDDAERVLAAHETSLFQRGEHATLLDWYLRFPPPEDDAEAAAQLIMRVAWAAVLSGQPEVAGAQVARIEGRGVSRGPAVDAELLLLRAFLAQGEGDVVRQRTLARAARAALGEVGAPADGTSTVLAVLTEARADIALGEPEAAVVGVEEGLATGVVDPYRRSVLLGCQAWALAEQGEADAAAEVAEESLRLSVSAGAGPWANPDPWSARARARRLQGRLEEAEADLAVGRRICARHPQRGWTLPFDIEHARVLADAGDPAAGVAWIEEALFARPVLPTGWATRADDLLAELRDRAASVGDMEPLSPREREVLARLPSRASNQDIADELLVSLHTVKSHVQHIYRKLGAPGRDEAVARARALGLLPDPPT